MRIPFDGVALGCDYNPEQWSPDVWREDVALMREAGVGFVTLGVFSWALLQPSPDTWDFGWLDEVVGLLHDGGIAIDMATATAAPPPWLTTAHPEILTVDRTGATLWPGSRQSWCPSSPVFREHALALVERMVTRYGGHPAVRMWHVSNELGCHNGRCWCDVSAAAFRRWLADRYGDVDALNAAWGTAFWSQHYTGFDEVLPPRITPAVPNPTHELDFARFSSDELLAYHRAERDVLRRSTDRPVTTNFMVSSHQNEQDYFAWAPDQDVVSQDHYLDARLAHPRSEQAFTDDLTRGVAGGPWMLMESATSAVNWQPVNVAKRPGELLLDSLRHVARGADTVGFFQWRASVAGGEKFHSALVPHAGADSARFREVVGLGAALASLGDVAGRPVTADVALLWDWNAWWACDLASHPSQELQYVDAVHRWHKAVTDLGATADVVHPSADLSGFRLVIVPTLYLCDDRVEPALRGVAERGGHVLVTYFSGIVDGNDHVRLGGYPGAFRDLLGVRVEEFAPLAPGASVALDDGSRADLWTEVLTTRGAEVVASYTDGPLPGTAAITRSVRSSGGTAWYVATRLDEAATSALADRITREAGVHRLDEARPGVEVVRRGPYAFVLNRSDSEVTVPASGRDVLTGTDHHGKVTVAPGSVAVVREGTG
jgi:beta-galactosidase